MFSLFERDCAVNLLEVQRQAELAHYGAKLVFAVAIFDD